jgi:hypothetical protein
MTIGPRPDALEPGFHCVRTHWIRDFMAFQLAWRTRTVMLVVPTCPESGFWSGVECGAAGYRRAAWRQVTGVPVVAVRSA